MQFFITATGTDIGKTFILEKLYQKFSVGNQKCQLLKPIISGFNIEDQKSDSAKILRILNKEFNAQNLDQISPWRLAPPLSPNIASNLENKKIDFDEVVNFCAEKISAAKKSQENLLIEGAGGVMTPINNQKTFLDLIAHLDIPAILVCGNYLGTISHTLTAIEAMKTRQIKIDRIILNVRENDESDPNSILQTLKNFTEIKIEVI